MKIIFVIKSIDSSLSDKQFINNEKYMIVLPKDWRTLTDRPAGRYISRTKTQVDESGDCRAVFR